MKPAKTRAQEKAESRERDEADLKAGRITPEELRRKNSLFARLKIRLDIEHAKKVR